MNPRGGYLTPRAEKLKKMTKLSKSLKKVVKISKKKIACF